MPHSGPDLNTGLVTRPSITADITEADNSGAYMEQLLGEAWAAHYEGQGNTARSLFRSACSVDPVVADGWAALGDSLMDEGNAAGASTAYLRALILDRKDSSNGGPWHLRLALVQALLKDARAEEARDLAEALVADRGDAADARVALAQACQATGQLQAAIEQQREAALLRRGDREITLQLARMLDASGDALEAMELIQPLARQDAGDVDIQLVIASLWISLNEPAKASTVLDRLGDELSVDQQQTRLALQERLGQGADDNRLSPTYVRALFDRYAERFDRDLVQKLSYCGPALVEDVLDRLSLPKVARTLDLGCGTGLAGEVLRSRTQYLAGVDLAPRMVSRARSRGIYDELSVGDVIAAMNEQTGAWDLLVAADVLIYLGDMGEVLTAAAAALRPGGWFVATAESISDGTVRLQETRRFAHSEAHIRAMAGAAGLEVAIMLSASARREKGVHLPGLVFALGKPR